MKKLLNLSLLALGLSVPVFANAAGWLVSVTDDYNTKECSEIIESKFVGSQVTDEFEIINVIRVTVDAFVSPELQTFGQALQDLECVSAAELEQQVSL